VALTDVHHCFDYKFLTSSLQKLDAHGNCLPTLPKELEELQELTSLDVSHNSISDYPGRIYRLGMPCTTACL
jgi:Leucine-rich repeat (LRR) protein